MTRLGTVWLGVLLVPVNYYVATFCLWLGHWFSHLPGSPLRKHHVLSHHRLYPDSSRCRTSAFRFASGAYDSNRALLPWLLPPAIVYLLALPTALGVVSCLELAVATGVVAWLHIQFHLTHSPVDRWRWFETARARHAVHHDRDVNFGVGDHFWDRLFGCFAEAPPS